MGWPWASSINNSLERNWIEGLNPLGHQANLPRLNRLWQSQKPLASYTNSFTEVRMRLVKTNTVPLNGSSSSFCRHKAFKPSMPFLKSMGSTANNNQCCGVICSIVNPENPAWVLIPYSSVLHWFSVYCHRDDESQHYKVHRYSIETLNQSS